MIGEIRDFRKTAQIAIQASLTGHLVPAWPLHTNDAASAVTRPERTWAWSRSC